MKFRKVITLTTLFTCTVTFALELNLDRDLEGFDPSLAADIKEAYSHALEVLEVESDQQRRADVVGQLALILHAQQLLPAAEAAYTVALENRDDYAYRYLLAIILLQRGETDEATVHLEQTVFANPEYVPAWYRLGQIRLLQGDAEGAHDALTTALKIYSRSAAILTGLADVSLQKEDFETAIEQLSKAWVYEPGNGRIAYKLATAYRLLGDEQKSEDWSALADPSSPLPGLTDPLLVELAGLSRSGRFFAQAAEWAFQRGDPKAAEEALLQATQLEPQNVEYASKYALLLKTTQRYDEAIAEVKRLLAANPESAAGWYALAQLLKESSDGEQFVQGLVAVRRSIELDDSSDSYRTLAAAMSMQASLYDHAQEYYMQLLERNPTNPYYYYWFGLSRLAEKQCDGREALSRAVAMKKDWGEAHVALARGDAFCGNVDQAESRLRALASAASDADILTAQAYVALLAGDADTANTLASPLVPDPDAQMIVDAINTGATPDRMFADDSTWWVPPEFVH